MCWFVWAVHTQGGEHLDQRRFGNGVWEPVPALEGRANAVRIGQLLEQVGIHRRMAGGRVCGHRWPWCVLLV